MGRAPAIVARALAQDPRPEPAPDARRSGIRRTQADGSITVVDDWDQPGQPNAPVVDRSPERVFD